jgi:hypothetical protein
MSLVSIIVYCHLLTFHPYARPLTSALLLHVVTLGPEVKVCRRRHRHYAAGKHEEGLRKRLDRCVLQLAVHDVRKLSKSEIHKD